MSLSKFREAMNSPVLLNIVYWSFLLAVAVHVSPMVLFILLLLPGFVSDDSVTVTSGSTTFEINAERGTGE